MALFTAELTKLKKLLQSERDFGKIADYFFSNLAEHPRFLDVGKPKHDPMVEAIIKNIGNSIFRKEVPVTQLMLIHIAEQDFYHGPCMINGKMTNVFFFKGDDVGMLSIVMNMQTGETSHIRFTSILAGNADDPVFVSPPITDA